MATYAQLTAQYEALPKGTGERWRFRKDHPKWWENYQANKAASPTGDRQPLPDEPPPITTIPVDTPGGSEIPAEEEAPPEAPPKPSVPDALALDGWDYVWDGENWVLTQTQTSPPDPYADTPGGVRGLRASLRAWIESNFLPEQVAPAMAFIENALTSGDPFEKIIADLQETQFFKDAYPELELLKAKGLGTIPLSTIRSYRQQMKAIAKSIYGTTPSDQQLANLIGNNVSPAEFDHRLRTFKRIDAMGGPVRAFFEEGVGINMSDEDLYEWFDPDIIREDLDKAYEDARIRGMPVLFGLKPRSQAEADALQAMAAGTGISVDEIISRMQSVGQNASRFERLAAIEAPILEGLPDNFGEFFKDIPNELLWQAEVWQNPFARSLIQDLVSREGARWRQRGGAVSTASGQQIGLLSQAEKQSFG